MKERDHGGSTEYAERFHGAQADRCATNSRGDSEVESFLEITRKRRVVEKKCTVAYRNRVRGGLSDGVGPVFVGRTVYEKRAFTPPCGITPLWDLGKRK